MKSIAKNNFITILQRLGEDIKEGFSSILMGNLPLSSQDISLDDFSESNPETDILIKSTRELEHKATEFQLNVGVPSKVSSKTPKITSEIKQQNRINPIINNTINNDNNISLTKNRDVER